MVYAERISKLYSLTRFGEKMTLDGPRELHRHLGHPLDSYDSILVGGTNGKGSTCICLESLLRSQGLKVGLFTSPHMNQFAERIRVDGRPIPEEQVIELVDSVYPGVRDRGGSFFEAVWGMATLAFAQNEVDIAIWEVGLGGRLDATNVAEPILSAITNIGLDHTHVLGHTLGEIAREKSAIFRPGRPALTSAQGAGLEALRTTYAGALIQSQPLESTRPLGLLGAHQRQNAGLAISIARQLGYGVDYGALETIQWPGRCEFIDGVLLDCAHNPAGIETLAQVLPIQEAETVHVVFGVMEGKDISAMAAGVESWAQRISVVTPDYPRRRPASEVVTAFKDARVAPCLRTLLDQRVAEELTVVCGSGFLVAEARAHLLGLEYPEHGLRTHAR